MDIFKFAKWIGKNKNVETIIIFCNIFFLLVSAVGLAIFSPYYIIGLIIFGTFSAYLSASK